MLGTGSLKRNVTRYACIVGEPDGGGPPCRVEVYVETLAGVGSGPEARRYRERVLRAVMAHLEGLT